MRYTQIVHCHDPNYPITDHTHDQDVLLLSDSDECATLMLDHRSIELSKDTARELGALLVDWANG